jgi:hypothetical protein
MRLANRPEAWRDNRVEYFYDHPDEVAASRAVAFVFGAGVEGQTTPSTDGGYLAARQRSYRALGGVPACP